MNKKVISFSLWGNNPKYTIGAIKNAKLALDIYKGWTCRFHVGKDVPSEIVDELRSLSNTEVLVKDGDCNWTGMFWRFEDAADPSVSVMLSRDTDSRLTSREKAAVDEWLESNKSFHIMRDHPGHCTQIMGGMWGVKHPKLANIVEMISSYQKGDFWQVDQNFLARMVYPLIQDDSFVHDEYHNFDAHARPFPTPRLPGMLEGYPDQPLDYIGKALKADDSLCWGDGR
tara:strand:+ start:2223 stop:2906 length:684 start_codon:yes stop_codon:yes gene_type:complete